MPDDEYALKNFLPESFKLISGNLQFSLDNFVSLPINHQESLNILNENCLSFEMTANVESDIADILIFLDFPKCSMLEKSHNVLSEGTDTLTVSIKKLSLQFRRFPISQALSPCAAIVVLRTNALKHIKTILRIKVFISLDFFALNLSVLFLISNTLVKNY